MKEGAIEFEISQREEEQDQYDQELIERLEATLTSQNSVK